MASITPTNMIAAAGTVSVTETTLTGTDDFVYSSAKKPILILRNPTAGSLSPVIDGDAASANHKVVGVGSIDLTGGYAVGAIAAGASVSIKLSTIEKYLVGTIALTAGGGLVATLLEF